MKKNTLENIVMTLTATSIMAAAIGVFYKPSGLTLGGVSGLSLALYHLTGIEPSLSILILNIVLLVIGFCLLNKEVICNTVLGSLAFPSFLSLIEKTGLQVSNPYIACIVGPVLMGLACYILLRYKSSSGGSDSLALILNKLYAFKIESVMLMIDAAVLLLSLSYLNLMTICLSFLSLFIQISLLNALNNITVHSSVLLKA